MKHNAIKLMHGFTAHPSKQGPSTKLYSRLKQEAKRACGGILCKQTMISLTFLSSGNTDQCFCCLWPIVKYLVDIFYEINRGKLRAETPCLMDGV